MQVQYSLVLISLVMLGEKTAFGNMSVIKKLAMSHKAIGLSSISLAGHNPFMGIHGPEFQPFFQLFLHHFVLAKLDTSSITVKEHPQVLAGGEERR